MTSPPARRSGPIGTASHRTPAKESSDQKGTTRRPRLTVVPPFRGPEPEVPEGFPSPPNDTRHEWLVSWHWPNDSDNLRRRMFHTREAADAYRDRIERQVRDADDAWKPGPQVIVRIDVRDVLPWREVG